MNELKIKNISPEIKELIEQLDNLLFTKKEPIVISLQGYWGIGKTYFWNDYITHKTQENKHVYISLFGVNSLDDIKRKIILKISDRAKISNIAKKFLGTSKFSGFDLSSMISLMEPKDFKNIIICFDDFERLSKNLSILEVLGFISELKEQYKCKIVLINNNEILREYNILEHKKVIKKDITKMEGTVKFSKKSEEEEFEKYIYGRILDKNRAKNNNLNEEYIITNNNNYEILSIFSEKIIDIVLKYEPSIDDLLNLLKNNENTYIDFNFISSLFVALENRNKRFNLRLMKQLIIKIELVEDIIKNNKIAEHYKYGIIFNIFRLVIKENIEVNKISFSKDIQSSVRLYHDELFDLIYRHKFNVAKISKIFEKYSLEDQLKQEEEKYRQKLNDLYYRYLYDLKYNDNEFVKDFYTLLQTDKFDLTKVVSLSTLSFYIDLLSKIDNKNQEKYNQFLFEKIKEYIENNLNRITSAKKFNDFLNEEFIRKLNKNKELKEFYTNIKKSIQDKESLDKDKTIELIKDIYQENKWDDSIENLLNSINENLHLEWLEEDQEYFQEVLNFMIWIQKFSGRKPFQDFNDKTISAYQKFYENKDYRNKMDFVLEKLSLEKINSSLSN